MYNRFAGRFERDRRNREEVIGIDAAKARSQFTDTALNRFRRQFTCVRTAFASVSHVIRGRAFVAAIIRT